MAQTKDEKRSKWIAVAASWKRVSITWRAMRHIHRDGIEVEEEEEEK